MKKIIKSFIEKIKIVTSSLFQFIREKYWQFVHITTPIVKIKNTYHHIDYPTLKCAIAYNQYGGYCVPQSSAYRSEVQRILLGKVHEPETIEYLLNHCGNKDIIHAGTFFGDFLPALSKGIDKNAFIWAFEPNIENFRCAKITLALNEIKNVKLINVALGAKAGQSFVKIANRKGQALGSGSYISPSTLNKNTVQYQPTNISTIDEIIPNDRKIGILQLDIEGYEKEALSGALHTINRCLPIIMLEVNDTSLIQSHWFLENIINLGYKKHIKVHNNFVFLHKA
ncbi:FkbM family methyltransferase [Candidatus Nitrosacidococcus tergens]|nr:FkbM family methyltransferase [Candidatus Nitrosacidococcus tergens]